MKMYISDYASHAGKWIYKGYQKAWSTRGFDICKINADQGIGEGVTNTAEEYMLMMPAVLVNSQKILDIVAQSNRAFIFAQPNWFPHPWGTHPNFVECSHQSAVAGLNKLDNVCLWSFADINPEYYNKWKKVHTIPLAYDSIGYKHIPDEKCKKFDISFVGGWADNGFDEKRKIMVDIFSKFMNSGLNCGFFVNKNLTHEQECKVLHNSRVTLNVHDAYQRTLGLDTNERTFKSLGLNGCLVSDTVGQLNNLFPTVKTSLESEELVQITKDYLSLTDAELNVIKEENRQLILDKHCYTNRVDALLAL